MPSSHESAVPPGPSTAPPSPGRAALLTPGTAALAAAVVTIAVWVMFIVVARASAGGTLKSLDVMVVRFAGAGLAALPWILLLRRRNQQSPDAGRRGSLLGLSPLPLRLTALCALTGGLLYASLSYSGFFFAPAAHGSTLLPGSLPLWTALLSVLVLGERLSPRRYLGLGLLLAGGLTAALFEFILHPAGQLAWIGDLLFLGAAFSWACYAMLLRRHGLNAIDATLAVVVFSAIVFIPIYAVLVASGLLPSRLSAAPWSEILAQAAFQGVMSVLVSGISFAMMVRHYGPVRTTMITAAVPGLSAIAATLILGEPLHLHLVLGLVLVTSGILIGALPARATGQAASR